MGPVAGVMVQTALLCNEDGRVDLDRKYEPDPAGPAGQLCPGWAEDGGIEVRCTNELHLTRLTDVPRAALAAGVSYRRLDHWITQGWVACDKPNPGSGKPRRITEHEAAVTRLMSRLIEAGVTPATAARLSRDLWDGREARLTNALVVGWSPMQASLRESIGDEEDTA